MESEKIKERAYSLASYRDLHRKNELESSPEFRPTESADVPPPISLSPSILENRLQLKELLEEKQQDQHLINLLKKHTFEQAKEITKLKSKLEHLQRDYELLIEKSKSNQDDHHSIIETAILARSRSESLNNYSNHE